MKLLSLILLIPVILLAQTNESYDPWQPFRFFAGSWSGQDSGMSGVGKGTRTYEFIMNGKYLYFRNQTVFEPQEKNPKGEVHEDWTFYSYDKIRKKHIMRAFNSEGFVNQFVLDSLSSDGKSFVFLTEQIENLPPGFRARMTYTIKNENEFIEQFDIAAPEKDFKRYIENFWTRIK